GIPKRAFRRVPHAYSIILPVVTEIPNELKDREMKMKKVSIPLYSADFGWKVSYIVPPPHRIKLGVFLEELENGLKVLKVEEGSNAARMNLQPGDVLLQLDGDELADVEDLAAQLQKRNFGDKVRLLFKRGDSEQDVSGVLQEPPKTE
ncbi:MAG: PDZ domain-containing protein, partial [Nitrospinae bacterium]|nr:PDZ domain-containing protein [Nitrospinota bacterium]